MTVEIDSKIDGLTSEEVTILKRAANKQWGQPKFKAKNFVGNSQIHPYAIFRQYLLELRTREEVCMTLEHQTEGLKLTYEIKCIEEERQKDELKKKKARLKTIKAHQDLMMHGRRQEDAYKERKQYLDLIQEFIDSPKDILPDGRRISELCGTDEAFDEEMESQYWTVRLAKQVALDFIQYGKPSGGNMDAILMLEGDQQNQVLSLATDLFVRVDDRNRALIGNAADKLNLGYKPSELAELTFVKEPELEKLENK